MIEINCNGCNNHCCGKNSQLTPVLLPSEEKILRKYSIEVKTPYRKIRVLAKKENGNCIFLDDELIRCINYYERPLECRLYPFLLVFSGEEPDVELDERFCPHLNKLLADKKMISVFIKRYEFPKDWVDAYKTLENY